MPFSNQNWAKFYGFFFTALAAFLLLDRWLKNIILEGFSFRGECASLVFALNEGVAFSMFAFLGDHLKWIQLGLLGLILAYVIYERYLRDYPLAVALVMAGGIGNIYDRFVHGGVVDYIYWHCGFEFAIFNLADVMINVAVAILLIKLLLPAKEQRL